MLGYTNSRNAGKTFLLISFFFLLITQLCFAQWFWQNPLPQGNDLEEVYSFNQNTAIAVGATGTILKTIDGGLTWSFQTSGTEKRLKDVYFIDEQTGWAAGEGVILKTTNGGDNWDIQFNNSLYYIWSIHFVDPFTGWGVTGNGKILKTIDGGYNWDITSFSSNAMYSVFFTDLDHGWICGSFNSILRTTNGGTNWLAVGASASGAFYSLCFTDSLNGVATGTSGIVRSTNGGTSWFYANQYYRAGLSICLLENGKGWAVGTGRSHAFTSDGGFNWSYEPGNGAYAHLYSVSASNECSVWMVGEFGNIFKSTSGLINLIPISTGTIDELRDVFFIDNNNGWIVGGKAQPFDVPTIYKTTNSGINWIPIDLPLDNTLFGLHFLDKDVGWAVGAEGFIFKTNNGGFDWSVQQNNYPNTLMDVFFINDNTGWIVGTGETILKTTNAGVDWIDKSSGLTTSLSAVFFVNENIGWATGPNGQIIKSTNGGDNWESQVSGFNFWLADVFFLDSVNGWIAGGSGRVLKTTNGGTTWTDQLIAPTTLYDFYSVYFIDQNNGWACGSYGIMMKTTNGGETWLQEGPYTSYGLNSTFFIESQTGWAVGYGGGILKFGNAPNIGNLNHNNLNLSISDFNSTEDIIFTNYPKDYLSVYTLIDVELLLDTIFHSSDADLTITLSHLGITDTLAHQVGGDGANFINTKILDASLTSISEGSPPFTGNFKPQSSLSTFAGIDPNGDWKLSIYDGVTSNTGILQAWGIKLYFENLTNISNQTINVAKDFTLNQNYPNPFNPSTKISWQSPVSSWQTIKVYDVLGNEVAALVNEEKPAGSYEVEFNPNCHSRESGNLSSGIYFYQLRAGSFIETKKMILLK